MGSSGASCGATAKAEESEGKEIRFPRGVAASSSPLQIPHGKIIGGNNRAFSNRGFGRIKRLRSIFHANGYDDGGSGGAGASRLSGAAGRYDGSDPAAEAGYQTPDRPRENAGVSAAASEPIGLAGRLFRGSFGACFSGHGQTSDDELTPLSRGNERSGGVSGVRLDQPGEIAPREFALKMALTLRGQDPAQVNLFPYTVVVQCGTVRCGAVRYSAFYVRIWVTLPPRTAVGVTALFFDVSLCFVSTWLFSSIAIWG